MMAYESVDDLIAVDCGVLFPTASQPGVDYVIPDISYLLRNRDKLRGIVSERDYARQVILKGRNSHDTPVADIMTARVVCVDPERTIEECMALMTERRIRHLPVVKDSHVTGVISIGDVVSAVVIFTVVIIFVVRVVIITFVVVPWGPFISCLARCSRVVVVKLLLLLLLPGRPQGHRALVDSVGEVLPAGVQVEGLAVR